MKPMARWQTALFSLALAGCTQQTAPLAPAAKPAPVFETIRLERHPCFGNCPVYAVEIDRNGKGSFIGEEHVKAKGTHAIQLAPGDIALLSSVIERSGVWSLKEHYQSAEDGCETVWTDQSGLAIRVVRQGQKKTVALNHGCRGSKIPAAALDWLADTIDYLANTRPLIVPGADN